MDQVQISAAASWRQRCYDKLQSLRAHDHLLLPNNNGEEEVFGEKNCEVLELQKAIQKGNVDKFVEVLEKVYWKKKVPLSDIFDQVTPANDSLLHEAAYFGRAEIAELIGHHFPQLLNKTNIDGDTPLHVAARSNKTPNLINLILSQSTSTEIIIITRLTNECGNTALHEAVSSKHVQSVTLLFEADKFVAHYLNKSGQSPLYLAVLTSIKELVEILLEAPFPDERPLPKHQGNSPLHAAIYTRNADLLKEIANKKPDVMYLRDEEGGTPLHYAAASGYVEGVGILLEKSTLVALEFNSEGDLPIHLAAKFGHIEVVKQFLRKQHAYARVLLNKKGQNILHVAAQNRNYNVVLHILGNTELVKQLGINKKDQNGNTPLHLAASNDNCVVIFLLVFEKGIDLNLINNQGLTARDMFVEERQIPMTGGQEVTNLMMKLSGAKMSDKGKGMAKGRVGEKDEKMKERMNTLMVVAILIATVTFAAGFTVPGGVYSSDDPNPHKRGMAVLGHKTQFKIFIGLDIIAMYSSTFASFMLLGAELGKLRYLRAFSIAHFLVGVALTSMTPAFALALTLIMPSHSFRSPISLIGIITFTWMLLWSNISLSFICFHLVPLYIAKSLSKIHTSFVQSVRSQN